MLLFTSLHHFTSLMTKVCLWVRPTADSSKSICLLNAEQCWTLNNRSSCCRSTLPALRRHGCVKRRYDGRILAPIRHSSAQLLVVLLLTLHTLHPYTHAFGWLSNALGLTQGHTFVIDEVKRCQCTSSLHCTTSLHC